MKYLLKKAAIIGGLEAIHRLRAERLFPKAAGRGLIFTLHHVRPKPNLRFDPNAHLEVTPGYLQSVIEASLAAGLVPARLQDLPDLLADPSDTRRFVCFTLDDGYRNNAEYAAPLFRRFGIPYTIFVTPGFVDRTTGLWWETAAAVFQDAEPMSFDFGRGPENLPMGTQHQKVASYRRLCHALSKDRDLLLTRQFYDVALRRGIDWRWVVDRLVMNARELRALAADPLVDFGGHTMTHPKLSEIPEEALAREIGQSVREVAALTGRNVTTFAYPYGTSCAAGPREFEAARNAGLRVAVTTRPGMLTEDTFKAPMSVNRVSLNGLYQNPDYIPALLSGLPFQLRNLI